MNNCLNSEYNLIDVRMDIVDLIFVVLVNRSTLLSRFFIASK